jgi:hypothetical protein
MTMTTIKNSIAVPYSSTESMALSYYAYLGQRMGETVVSNRLS